jgi:hypothetical protein
MRRTIAALAALSFLLGACGAGKPQGGEASASERPTAAPPAKATPAATAAAPTSRDAWLAAGRQGSAELHVFLAGTGEQMFEFGPGIAADAEWSHWVSVDAGDASTTITDLVVQPGAFGPSITIDGQWAVPTIGDDPTPVGLSNFDHSRTLVLVEANAEASRTVSRFAIVSLQKLAELDAGMPGVTEADVVHVIEVSGRMDFDAISRDGSKLYVVEHLAGDVDGRYQVRMIHTATGALDEVIIADKRNAGEGMAGWPIAQLRREDGRVLTLYRGYEHPFIHALDTTEGWAVCIDLPAIGVADPEAALDWGLAQTADGQSVYAANATLGLVVQVNPVDLVNVRTARLEALASRDVVLAKFGHQQGGTVGRRAVLAETQLGSPSVERTAPTLFAAGAGGILAIDTGELAEIGRYLPGRAVSALGLTPDGSALYVLVRDEGTILKLDPATGTVLGQAAGDGYDRLLAVVPW